MLNVLPQKPRDITVGLSDDIMALGDEFKVHKPVKVEENYKHAPDPIYHLQASKLDSSSENRYLVSGS